MQRAIQALQAVRLSLITPSNGDTALIAIGPRFGVRRTRRRVRQVAIA